MTQTFTTRKAPIEFMIDEESFYLKPSIPAGKMTELSRLAGEMQSMATDPENSSVDPLMKVLAEIFEAESFERFIKRYNGEYAPIDIATFYEIITWVIGEAVGKGITSLPST